MYTCQAENVFKKPAFCEEHAITPCTLNTMVAKEATIREVDSIQTGGYARGKSRVRLPGGGRK